VLTDAAKAVARELPHAASRSTSPSGLRRAIVAEPPGQAMKNCWIGSSAQHSVIF